MATWHFSAQQPDDVDDEDTVAKNFARESRNLSGIFVREFFQNVLDASCADSVDPDPPHVRIAYLDESEGPIASNVRELVADVVPHLRAAGHETSNIEGLVPNALVLEEFGTTGLIGTTDNSRARGRDERWANFWFGEGKRTKGGNKLGRAGQGKITYHLVSEARSVFALTHRDSDDRRLLFGKCIVHRTHQVEDQFYKRHGYWPRTNEDHQPLPAVDQQTIDRFCDDFGLRVEKRTGTSWIIPCVDPETFSRERLIADFLKDFFFSVMAGTLTADIMNVRIDRSTLRDVLEQHPLDDLPPAFVGFLEEALSLPGLEGKAINVGADWYGEAAEQPMAGAAFLHGDLDQAREALEAGRLVAVRLPVPIHHRNGEITEATISVYLMRSDVIEKTREVYERCGLVIGEEQHLRNAPGRYYGLVRASDAVISEFLGYAEEASHMKWNARESEVNARYTQVAATIARVRRSLPKLAKLLIGHTSQRQDDALIDILSVPLPTGKKGRHGTRRKKARERDEPDADQNKPTPSLPRFRVDQSDGTWRMLPGPGAEGLAYPVNIDVKLAYETLPGEGDPFKEYHRFDFDLADRDTSPILVTNAEVVYADRNRLQIRLDRPEFSVAIDGFSGYALKSRIWDSGAE